MQSGATVMVTTADARPACFITFVSASCTMRYPVRRTLSGTGVDTSPTHRISTDVPVARTVWASASMASMTGAGARRPRGASSERSTPSMRRSSCSAERPVVSIASSARLASSGWVSITCTPTPACTVITLMAWATTSCSSRAIRSRSSATARAASSIRSRSSTAARASRMAMRSRRVRMISPTAHAAPNTKTLLSRSCPVVLDVWRVNQRTAIDPANVSAARDVRRRPPYAAAE